MIQSENLSRSTLHRYWMWSNRMREHCEKAILNPEWIQREEENVQRNPLLAGAAFFCDDPGIFMSYWYGSLYVVIEGWKELRFSDIVIDSLLLDPKVEQLRLYRNGAFHFQKNYWDHRFKEFIAMEGAAGWVRKVTCEFGRWFVEKRKSANNDYAP